MSLVSWGAIETRRLVDYFLSKTHNFDMLTKILKGMRSLVIAFILISIGFFLRVMYQNPTQSDLRKAEEIFLEYTVKKNKLDVAGTEIYRHELIRNNKNGDAQAIYSIENLYGFTFDVSKDGEYIAILNYGESMGDESLSIIKPNGTYKKDFGHLDSPQTLVPIEWTEHYYWLFSGIPIENPEGVIRINADTNQVEQF